jgi:predicted neuraminidase
MLKKLTIHILCIVAASQVTAAEPNLAATPATADFSPGPEYAGSARRFQGIPGIERAANGRLWATWYGGGTTEDEHNYILLSTSGDNGESWQPVLVLDPDRDGPVRALDPCLWHDPQGKLWLFWAQEATKNKARDPGSFVSFAITTMDSGSAGAKWSEPQRIAKGVMMNKPTVTKDNRWLLPIASWSQDGSARVLESRDQGTTFVELGAANVPVKARNADEHMVVEREDGTLWMLIRGTFPAESKEVNGIGESVSTDGGKTWSEVTASEIPHPVSRFFIRRLASGRLLLVRHDPPNHRKSRSHLTALLSEDDGRTWKGGLVFDERDAVSYPDGVQAPNGSIYMIYDHQRYADKEILMTIFTEKEVLEGKVSSPESRLRVLVNKATGEAPPKAPAGKAAR